MTGFVTASANIEDLYSRLDSLIQDRNSGKDATLTGFAVPWNDIAGGAGNEGCIEGG